MVKLAGVLGLVISGLCLSAVVQAEETVSLEKGQELYLAHCADCHGIQGKGNGPAAQKLDPPPADLHEALQQRIVSDEYLLWTIKEGGRNLHTDMPSFEETESLDEEKAKAIVRYLWHAFK